MVTPINARAHAGRSNRAIWLDGLFVGILILFALAGVKGAPFHGDESTIIAASRDWYALAIDRSPQTLFFRPNPPDPAYQELRLVNGPLSRYLIGALWSAGGVPVETLNQQWLWGADWAYNQNNGHIPSPGLLFVGRMASAFPLAISIAALFAIALRLIGRPGAYLSVVIYTLLPVVLLNGRRAMFEGTMLMGAGLTIWFGLRIATTRQPRLGTWIGFGIAAGLALASKHTTALIFAPALIGAIWSQRRTLRATGIGAAASLICVGIVFLALNPAWWASPLQMPGEVLRLRSALLDGQLKAFGGFTSSSAQIGALIDQTLGPPQYYEVSEGWPEWIGGQIAIYESSGLAGMAWHGIGLWIALGLALIGLISTFVESPSGRVTWLLIAAFSTLGVLALNPLPWQRYYLPLAMPVAVSIGAGVMFIAGRLQRAVGIG